MPVYICRSIVAAVNAAELTEDIEMKHRLLTVLGVALLFGASATVYAGTCLIGDPVMDAYLAEQSAIDVLEDSADALYELADSCQDGVDDGIGVQSACDDMYHQADVIIVQTESLDRLADAALLAGGCTKLSAETAEDVIEAAEEAAEATEEAAECS